MIKLEKTCVFNWENALRGMRNPMNSWAKSDTYFGEEDDGCCGIAFKKMDFKNDIKTDWISLGENDLALMKKLIKAGSDHRKFMRQLIVSVDITAPLYWWKEYDTYKVGTVANSTSTMHKIHSKKFARNDFSCERMSEAALDCLDGVIATLEEARRAFVDTKEICYWDDMIQLLPSSYNQTRTCTLSYENLLSMYRSRKHHKLSEWREFCAWIEKVPYFSEMCLEE